MPKKKKVKELQPKRNLPVSGNANTAEMVPELDEKSLQKTKEEMIKEQPELKHLFGYMEKITRESTAQAQNSSIVFRNKRGKVTPELLMQFPDSPTAKQTMVALNHYIFACNILWSYTKPRVLVQSDCDFLEPGLHHYMEGYMIAMYMSQQFPPPPTIEILVEDYLRLRPNDSLVEYFHVSIIVAMRASTKSDFESCKEMIRAREMFVHKLFPYKNVETVKRILIDSYYNLGAKYTSTDQDERALDAFEKCYALDETNIGALYSVAFHYKEKDPEKAIKLCEKYLGMAPKCDEKYPNIHYVMGYIYAIQFKNIDLAKKYYDLGMEAENYRLPFNPPTDFGPKTFLESIVPLAGVKRNELKNALEDIDLD
ncbi:uncharacterized protein LOC123526441 [Mercenaria mercenaria]|uniref:uncharacterized protein LOC123526441 n=1 Tax=Mercenaria mercenaria TaxID=6596 RepID=UPI00234E5481|nr:uncharacterized protein LOC123526441 [Mercenaria mercenaria]